MLKRYAVKYLDSNGYTVSTGYIETGERYKPGDIIHHLHQIIKIDFEL